MTHHVTIFGYGPSGRAIADLLANRGERVRIAQRTRPADLPARIDAIREKLAATGDDVHIELDLAIGEQPEVIESIAACISRRSGSH